MKKSAFRLSVATALLCSTLLGISARAEKPTSINVPAGDLITALRAFTKQTGIEVVYLSDRLSGLRTPGVQGTLLPQDALVRMLRGTALEVKKDASGAVLITAGGDASPPSGDAAQSSLSIPADNSFQLARAEPQGAPSSKGDQSPAATSKSPAAETDVTGVPEILVKGARGGSTDIRRSNDGVQPYVVFDSEELERSMAPSLDDFLRTRLPMNQSRGRADENTGFVGSAIGNRSQINLRGLGVDETLVLVNGRRMPGAAGTLLNDVLTQPDINGIPMSAVERIEILPSTAGGIYGGGATGGVVNVVLKRDYTDVTVSARYDGTFDGGGAERRLDATAGFTLGQRTNIMLSASSRDGSPLYVGDRDFTLRARELMFQNNPNAFTTATTPIFGYTTNIRSVNITNPTTLASTLSNTPLVLRNGTALGSVMAHVAEGSRGYALDGAFAFRPGYNLDPAESLAGNRDSLRTVPTRRSISLNLQHEFTDSISAFLDAGRFINKTVRRGGQAPVVNQAIVTLAANNPVNPFTTPVRIAVPLVGFDTDRLQTPSDSISDRIGGGVSMVLPGNWAAHAEYSIGQSEREYGAVGRVLIPAGLTALSNGTLNPLRDVNLFPFDFSPYYATGADALPSTSRFPAEQTTGTLRLSGPLLTLPGGSLQLSSLLERREEFTGDRVQSSVSATTGTATYTYLGEVGAKVDSAYAELSAPLFSRVNARRGISALELMASYRYDKSAVRRLEDVDTGDAIIPSPDGPFPDIPYATSTVSAGQYTFGFRYAPIESVALRVSYGKGVLPPSPSQLSPIQDLRNADPDAIDPRRGNQPLGLAADAITISDFGTPWLDPEESESLSVGLIFKPTALPGLRVSIDYTQIKKKGEIGSLDFEQGVLEYENLFPLSVTRLPLTQADAALGYTGGVITNIHVGPVNIAESTVTAFDVQATYDWDTRFGSFAANLVGTVQPERTQQVGPELPVVNTVGYLFGPIKLRINGGLRWTLGSVDMGWDTQYYASYFVYDADSSAGARASATLAQGSPVIPSQTYHDVYGRYRFGDSVGGWVGGVLRNSELMLSVQNVLNTYPVTRATVSGNALGTLYAVEGNPRLRSYSVALTKRFN